MSKKFPVSVMGARAVVKLDQAETKTMGGIIIPGADKEPVTQGVIMTTGKGMRLNNGSYFPMEVEVGDRVILAPNAGTPIYAPGEEGEFLVINEAHIIAVVTD